MTSSQLKKTIVAFVAIAVLASGTAFAQTIASFSDRVNGFDTDVWRVWVPAGSSRVVINAGAHTDVDLEVRDEATGRLLAVDNDSTSYCIGDIYMAYSGYITIRIDNLGRYSNGYTVTVRN
jgi:hypothetical protein